MAVIAPVSEQDYIDAMIAQQNRYVPFPDIEGRRPIEGLGLLLPMDVSESDGDFEPAVPQIFKDMANFMYSGGESAMGDAPMMAPEDAAMGLLDFTGAGVVAGTPARMAAKEAGDVMLGSAGGQYSKTIKAIDDARAEDLKYRLAGKNKPLTKAEKDPREFSKISFDKPVEYTDFEVLPSEFASQRKIIKPEDIQNSILISGAGDLSGTGTLTRLGGNVLENPVDMMGGRNYGLLTPYGWGSGQSVTNTLRNRALSAQEEVFKNTGEELPVYLGYTTMNPRAIDFQEMQTSAVAEAIKFAPITKSNAKIFDEQFKKKDKNFVGVLSPNLREYLAGLSGEKKVQFNKLMDKDEFRKLGFPQIGEARYAMTEPELRNAPIFSSGMGLYKMDLSQPNISEPVIAHPSFDTAMPRTGGLLGFGEPISNKDIYRDWFGNPENLLSEKGNPMTLSQAIYSFGKKPNAYQVVDQELVDTLSGLLRY